MPIPNSGGDWLPAGAWPDAAPRNSESGTPYSLPAGLPGSTNTPGSSAAAGAAMAQLKPMATAGATAKRTLILRASVRAPVNARSPFL